MQHLAVTVDYAGAPGTRARPLSSGGSAASMPTWPSSAASPAVFSAFGCDAGTKNQPPMFVSGLQSTDAKIPTDYSCPSLGPCEIVLYARDFVYPYTGQVPGAAPAESRDEITIEAALGFPRLQPGMLIQLDGRPCIGFGALQCIYKLPPSSTGGLASGSEQSQATYAGPPDESGGRIVGSTIVRCFTALDLHAPSAAPAKKSCHSAPLCITIRIEPVASIRGVLDKIFFPSGVVPTAPRARLDVGRDADQSVEIHVDWTPQVRHPTNDSETARTRYTWSGCSRGACVMRLPAGVSTNSGFSPDRSVDLCSAHPQFLGIRTRLRQGVQQEDLHGGSRRRGGRYRRGSRPLLPS